MSEQLNQPTPDELSKRYLDAKDKGTPQNYGEAYSDFISQKAQARLGEQGNAADEWSEALNAEQSLAESAKDDIPEELEGLSMTIAGRELRNKGRFVSNDTKEKLENHLAQMSSEEPGEEPDKQLRNREDIEKDLKEAQKSTRSAQAGGLSATERNKRFARELELAKELSGTEEKNQSESESQYSFKGEDLVGPRLAVNPENNNIQEKTSEVTQKRAVESDKAKDNSENPDKHKIRQEVTQIMRDIMQGEGAQKAFSQGGEQAELLRKRERLEAVLTESRLEYARLTALRRTVSTFGHAKELERAREAYEAARNNFAKFIREGYETDGLDESDIDLLLRGPAINEALDLSKMIDEERLALAENEKAKRFMDIWRKGPGEKLLSKAGFKRKLKQVMTVAGIGLAAGLTAGAAFGAVAAGVATGAISGSIRARAKVNYDVDNKIQADRDKTEERQKQIFSELESQGKEISGSDITGSIEEITKGRVNQNRRRMIGNTAIGAILGSAAAVAAPAIGEYISEKGGDIAEWAQDALNDTPKVNAESMPKPEVDLQAPNAPEAPLPTESFIDTVASGDGITHTVRDLIAERTGVTPTPEQLKALYDTNADMLNRLPGVVEMPNVYGGHGFSAPGIQTEIPGELAEQLVEQFNSMR